MPKPMLLHHPKSGMDISSTNATIKKYPSIPHGIKI
jgi:hypothetical protein